MKHYSGIWLWELAKIRRDYLDALKKVQCKRVYLKVLDDATQGIFWGWQCTPDIVNKFKAYGIEVWGWGYIFDCRSWTDTSGILDAVRRAISCGIEGFVFDVEQEVTNPATHSQLQEILKRAKAIVPPGCLGYTSFGAPEFHKEVPYKMLNEVCDLQFPQIYFEKFTFGFGNPSPAENDAEVKACFQQHRNMGLNKPILPIWGSESDSQYPATANELQNYLAQYPGSSIWRAPNAGERGEVWNCTYDYAVDILVDQPPQPAVRPYQPAPIPLPLTQELQLGDKGKDVYILLCALMELKYLRQDDQVTDIFNTNVDDAVRWAQMRLGIGVDGVVGPITKSSLEKALLRARGIDPPPGFNGAKFAEFCEAQLRRNISWTPEIKFVQPFVQILGPQRWPWCGATVYWLINEFLYKPNGKTMPLKYPGMEATFALVEAFQQFFQKQGWYVDNRAGYVPPPGAIVMYDWHQIDINAPDRDYEDHIGVFLRINGDLFVCAEGNTDHAVVPRGRTAIKEQQRRSIQGFGVIPEGWIPV